MMLEDQVYNFADTPTFEHSTVHTQSTPSSASKHHWEHTSTAAHHTTTAAEPATVSLQTCLRLWLCATFANPHSRAFTSV